MRAGLVDSARLLHETIEVDFGSEAGATGRVIGLHVAVALARASSVA
jgi:hypothetical protein